MRVPCAEIVIANPDEQSKTIGYNPFNENHLRWPADRLNIEIAFKYVKLKDLDI